MPRTRRAQRAIRRQRQEWDELARFDVFQAILRDPAHVRRPWSQDAFFESGDRDAELVLAAAARHGLPRRLGRALDFGCGIGRVTRALAKHFEEVVGVDLSPAMISRALELNEGAPRCSFVVSFDPDLRRFESGSFDLVLSLLVLQHLRSSRDAERYIRELVRVVSVGGVAIFQVPARIPPRRRVQSRRRLYGALRALGVHERLLLGRARLDPIRTTAVSERRVRAAVEDAGGKVLEVAPDDAAGPHIASRRYLVSREAPRPAP